MKPYPALSWVVSLASVLASLWPAVGVFEGAHSREQSPYTSRGRPHHGNNTEQDYQPQSGMAPYRCERPGEHLK